MIQPPSPAIYPQLFKPEHMRLEDSAPMQWTHKTQTVVTASTQHHQSSN